MEGIKIKLDLTFPYIEGKGPTKLQYDKVPDIYGIGNDMCGRIEGLYRFDGKVIDFLVPQFRLCFDRTGGKYQSPGSCQLFLDLLGIFIFLFGWCTIIIFCRNDFIALSSQLFQSDQCLIHDIGIYLFGIRRLIQYE